MRSDTKRLLTIAVILVGIVAAGVLSWRFREARRATLQEVRVVTATAGDPVFREGWRHLDPGEGFQLAVALRLHQRGRGDFWICPGKDLVLDGQAVDHRVTDRWPEKDRGIRVFWSTIECAFVGGELTQQNAGERLQYRTFLAPEYGRRPLVMGRMEAHNADFLGQLPPPPEPPPGTLRFYARVQVYADPSDLRPLQSASSFGPDHLWDPRLPVISRKLQAPEPIHPEVGELFLVPGMQPMGAGAEDADAVTLDVIGHPFLDLVGARLVSSSWPFAALAVAGTPDLDSTELQALGRITIRPGRLLRNGKPLRWGREVRPGDVFQSGAHWMVAVLDDGNGWLDLNDLVIHTWKAPASEVKLIDALDLGVTQIRQLRYEERKHS